MINEKDKNLAIELQEALEEVGMKVRNDDLPKLVSMYHKELALLGKGEGDNEKEGEAFESVIIWANDCREFDGDYIYWGEEEHSEGVFINYGKHRSNNTAIIRFHVKMKSKRKRLFDFWHKYYIKSEKTELDNVSSDFIDILKKNNDVKSLHKVEWCGWRYHREYHGPRDLIFGIKSVIEKDEYIYVAFDTEGVSDIPRDKYESESLSNLVFLLSLIDGVNKVWIKIRNHVSPAKELYTYLPHPADYPPVIETDLTADDEWSILIN